MKILKTLAMLFVLLALTVGAVAEVEYEPFEAGEITIMLPTGLQYAELKNCETPGEIEIKVDSANTDWSAVITDVDDYSDITFGLRWNLGGDKACVGTPGIVNLPNGDDWSFDAFYNVEWGYKACYEQMSKMPPSDSCYAEGGLATYDVNTNTLVPSVYDGTDGCYLMAIFFNDQMEAYRVKYATMRITHTNENAFQAKLNYVPKDRIVPSASVADEDKEWSDGSVTYTFAEGNQIQEIETIITRPTGAETYVATGCVNNSGSAENGVAVRFTGISEKEYYNSKAVSIVWYDANGEILLAERLDAYVSVGTPKAWPNYITDENVTKADVTFTVGKSANATTSSAIKADYDRDSGTVNVYADGEMPNEDMTQYMLFCKYKAPEGAAYAAHVTYEYIKFLGSTTTSYRYSNTEKHLSDPDLEPVENGVFVYEENLFRVADFASDTGLKVFYDRNSTKDNTGDVTMIDWYDDDGKFMNRQWLAKTYDSLAYVVPVEVENTVPTSAENPTLICADAGNGYKLQVTSYPQTTENGTQIQYELQLLDASGNAALLRELPGTVQLLIPYPDDVDLSNVTFTVNHYNAVSEASDEEEAKDDTVSAQDSYVEGISLERTDAGVLMTVESLSPFVLSWQDAICEHKNRTYTADKNTITEVCENTACDHKATWTIAVEESCVAGTEIGYKVTHTQNWLGGDPTIEYGNEATMEISSEMPTEPGEYYMFVKRGNAVLSFKFKVTAAPVMPATGDNSLPLALMAAAAALAMGCAFMLSRKARKA